MAFSQLASKSSFYEVVSSGSEEGSHALIQIPNSKFIVSIHNIYDPLSVWEFNGASLTKLPYRLNLDVQRNLKSCLGISSEGYLIFGALHHGLDTQFQYWDLTDIKNPIHIRTIDIPDSGRPDFLVVLPNDELLYGSRDSSYINLWHNGIHKVFKYDKSIHGTLTQIQLTSPTEVLIATQYGIHYFNIETLMNADPDKCIFTAESHCIPATQLKDGPIWAVTQLKSGEIVYDWYTTSYDSRGYAKDTKTLTFCEFSEKTISRVLPNAVIGYPFFLEVSDDKLILCNDRNIAILAHADFLRQARLNEIRECKKALDPLLNPPLTKDTAGLVCEYLGGLNRLFQPSEAKQSGTTELQEQIPQSLARKN